MVFLAIRS